MIATVIFQDGSEFDFEHEHEPKPSTHYRNRLGKTETIFAAPEKSLIATFYIQVEPICVIFGLPSAPDLAETAIRIEHELARLGNRAPREFRWIRDYAGNSEFIFSLDPWNKPRMRIA